MTNPTQPLPLAGLSRQDLALLASLASTHTALRAAGSGHNLLDNALAALNSDPTTPPALALVGAIQTARAVLFATPIGARKSAACGALVDLLARPGQPQDVNGWPSLEDLLARAGQPSEVMP